MTLKYFHWVYAKQYYYLNYNLGGDQCCANYRASSTVMIVFSRQRELMISHQRQLCSGVNCKMY